MSEINHHVIFIEGLPGSGKTTYAKRLAKYYQSLGIEVEQFNEGDLHPIDLAWCAYCNESEYDHILKMYPKLVEEIKKHTSKEDNHYIVSYTKVNHPSIDKHFYDQMEKYEVYQYASREKFLNVHKERWLRFNQNFDQNKIYIFECIFIQNHINELILNDNANLREMIQYFEALISTIQDAQPMVFYVEQANIEKTLKRIIEERRTTDPTKYRDWIDHVTRYVESTSYGKELGFLDIDGFIRYSMYRQQSAKEILKNLSVNYKIFELSDDYDIVFDSMKKVKITRDVY